MNVTGELVKVLDKEQGTSKAGKEWVKQSFVIKTDAKFNPEICFELFGEEKVEMLHNIVKTITIGEMLSIDFNLSSREYNGRYYTQASAWKVEKVGVMANEEELTDSPF
tara:strand:+ start:813 stop:1139 length:327 start_codon:yes stop_codon:yes gene_type:complete